MQELEGIWDFSQRNFLTEVEPIKKVFGYVNNEKEEASIYLTDAEQICKYQKVITM